jgi:hypothetical protein
VLLERVPPTVWHPLATRRMHYHFANAAAGDCG